VTNPLFALPRPLPGLFITQNSDNGGGVTVEYKDKIVLIAEMIRCMSLMGYLILHNFLDRTDH